MRNRNLSLISTVLLCLSMLATVTAADPPAKVQALIVTGDDVAPYHDWRENSEASREVLVESGRFDVRVCEDPKILESAGALGQYDVIVMVLYNGSLPTLTDPAKENLLNFVRGGKGFVTTHLSSAAFKEWDEYGKLCGRKWVMGTSGHGPRGVFEAKVAQSDHPITKGLEDFRIFDELYAGLVGDGPIDVLVTADSDHTNKTEPLVFTVKYGNGRAVHDAFGHDRKAIMDPSHRVLFVRSCEWAATGKVAE